MKYHNMKVLMLHCWVRGPDSIARTFNIKVSRTETVAALKEVIKDKKQAAFHNIDVDTLALYKPRDPLPRPYWENLSKLILLEHGELLEMGDDELSEVFPEQPPKHHIHIIVGM